MPTRGSFGPSSRASGWSASQSSSAFTSRPSKSLESTVTVPPDSPKPRESQVSTLNPALRSGPTPTLPVASLVAASAFFSRLPAHPWVCRIVAADSPGLQTGRAMQGDVDRGAVERAHDGIAGDGRRRAREHERCGQDEGASGDGHRRHRRRPPCGQAPVHGL